MFNFFNLFGSNSNSNPALNHLELVLSKKKKLKEKNLGKYYRALGGNYKIDYNKSVDNYMYQNEENKLDEDFVIIEKSK